MATIICDAENLTYFDSFGFFGNKNIYRIQACSLIMCGFCIGLTDFMLNSKSLLEYTNLFSSNKYKKNKKVILKYFQ